MTASPTLDGHVHVFTADMPMSPEAWARPSYAFSAEDLLQTFGRHGVERGVISAATLYGDYSDYTLDVLARYPQLRATVIVPPDVDPGRLRAMDQAGVVGVRLGIRRARAKPDLEAPEWRGLLSRLADLDWQVEILAQSSQMPQFLPPLEAAGVKIVADHLGLPDEDAGAAAPGFERLLKAVEAGRTWVKCSASYRTPWPLAQGCMSRLLQAGGPERLIWGSDAPFVGHEQDWDYPAALKRFEALVPDPDTRAAIDAAGHSLFFG